MKQLLNAQVVMVSGGEYIAPPQPQDVSILAVQDPNDMSRENRRFSEGLLGRTGISIGVEGTVTTTTTNENKHGTTNTNSQNNTTTGCNNTNGSGTFSAFGGTVTGTYTFNSTDCGKKP
jgi:hypothetical protein